MLLYIFEGWNRKLHEASEDFTWVVVFLKRLVVWRCEVTVWERLRPSGAQRHYSDQINNSFTDLFLYLFCRSLSCSALQLVTWIGFRVHSPCCNGPVCANATGCVCVCCRSLVLYSLCHTEYWLGGRWRNGSCLALLMLFLFWFFFGIFIFSHPFYFCSPRAPRCSLFALLHTFQSINICRQCQLSAPCWGHCAVWAANTVTPFSSVLLPLLRVQKELVVIAWPCLARPCMGATVCDTNEKSHWMHHPHKPKLLPRPHLLSACPVCRSEHTHTHRRPAVAPHLHLISKHRARFQCTVFTPVVSVSLPALAAHHLKKTYFFLF